MRVHEGRNFVEATERDEIADALSKRRPGEANEFWLSHGEERFPAICVFVRRDVASLIFFPREGHPGFTPSGNPLGLPAGGSQVFLTGVSGKEELKVPNEAVIPFDRAVDVAVEFAKTQELPKSIRWFEL